MQQAATVIPSVARDLGRMISDRRYCVYILSSTSRALYTGSTSNLLRRMYQHRHGLIPGFTRRYGITRLVYYDCTPNAAAAVARERELKSWTREKKLRLIETANAGWLDLAANWFERQPE
jgi:putative endonuclease